MAIKLVTFDSWSAVLAHLAVVDSSWHMAVRWVWYQAPLDCNPHLCRVVKLFKNGKVRLDPCNSGDHFTADASHLDRFRRKAGA